MSSRVFWIEYLHQIAVPAELFDLSAQFEKVGEKSAIKDVSLGVNTEKVKSIFATSSARSSNIFVPLQISQSADEGGGRSEDSESVERSYSPFSTIEEGNRRQDKTDNLISKMPLIAKLLRSKELIQYPNPEVI